MYILYTLKIETHFYVFKCGSSNNYFNLYVLSSLFNTHNLPSNISELLRGKQKSNHQYFKISSLTAPTLSVYSLWLTK